MFLIYTYRTFNIFQIWIEQEQIIEFLSRYEKRTVGTLFKTVHGYSSTDIIKYVTPYIFISRHIFTTCMHVYLYCVIPIKVRPTGVEPVT